MDPNSTVIMNPDEKRAEDVGIDFNLVMPLLDRKAENHPPVKIEPKLDDESTKPKPKIHMKLRRRGPEPRRIDWIWINHTVDKIKQKAFYQNFDNYHDKNSMPDNEHAIKLLELSKKTQLSQIDKFEFEGRQFIVVTWLSAIRIFEYNSMDTMYNEIRRMPQRHIGFESNLITSVHYRDCKLYIAFIDSTSDPKGYVEVRSLTGQLLESYSYDHVIKSIHSSENFICVRTTQNILYVHKKGAFLFNPYRIDMTSVTTAPLVYIYVKPVISGHRTYLRLITATPVSLIISRRDAREHSISQNYNFDPQYRTISMQTHNDLILIHRNLTDARIDTQPRSKVEIGRLKNIKIDIRDEYFVHERSIGFTHEILQIELSSDGESIFVLGRDSTNNYEVGQLRLMDIRTIWSTKVNNLDVESRILAQKNHLTIILDHKQHIVVKVDDQHNHAGLLQDVTQHVNKFLTK